MRTMLRRNWFAGQIASTVPHAHARLRGGPCAALRLAASAKRPHSGNDLHLTTRLLFEQPEDLPTWLLIALSTNNHAEEPSSWKPTPAERNEQYRRAGGCDDVGESLRDPE